MNSRTKIAASAGATLAAVAIAMPSADAAGRHWTTAFTVGDHAKLQVCRTTVDKGKKWKIYGRVNASASKTGTYTGQLTVINANAVNKARWTSKKTEHGKVSAVGSVTYAKTGLSLIAGVGAARSGNGGTIKPKNIKAC
jgi:hypothetical protein